MRVFKTRWFVRYARRHGIDDAVLCEAIRRAMAGLVNADLGHSLIKQRLARTGSGRSRGYRAIIAFRNAERCVFLYCYAKNEQANINDDELAAFQRLALDVLRYSDADMELAARSGALMEVDCHHEDI